MDNKKSFGFWKNTADNATSALSLKLNPINDHTRIDADFILKYADKKTALLDLGSGTGLIINKIYDKIGNITCVEPFEGFTKFIAKSGNVHIKHATLMNFEDIQKYDLITIFGVLHYFNEQEAVDIYTKYYPHLKKGGKLIVKNQFGVNEDVTVDGYSEEQKTNYFAQYRHIGKEQKMLETVGYKNIEIVDIYPPECNRWDNTHFYAIVAEK
jgi:predicted TPR repeat methyltransferase